MKVNDLSKELNITNKDLIVFLKQNGYSVSSHLQAVNDEMIAAAKARFVTVETKKVEKPVEAPIVTKTVEPPVVTRTYAPDELIPCRSIVPWKLCEVGLDQTTVYVWGGYGDVEYVTYRDLQAFRRKDIIKESKIIIENEDLCIQWARELGGAYKTFLNVDYPEEFFDLPDGEFEQKLKDAPETFRNVIKYTAINMVRNENYPTLQKINIIDSVLGTCIKEFL